MRNLKTQLKHAKRALQRQRREDARAKAQARRAIERDEWASFKEECTKLKH